jgi:hypothetical protein
MVFQTNAQATSKKTTGMSDTFIKCEPSSGRLIDCLIHIPPFFSTGRLIDSWIYILSSSLRWCHFCARVHSLVSRSPVGYAGLTSLSPVHSLHPKFMLCNGPMRVQAYFAFRRDFLFFVQECYFGC